MAAFVLGAMIPIAFVGTPFATSATVLWVGPTSGTAGSLLPDGFYGTPDTYLAGAFVGDQFINVDYPAQWWPVTGPFDLSIGESIDIGTTKLVDMARSAEGPLVIAGVSQGGIVVQQAEALLNDDPTIPSSTTFISIANPNFGAVSTYWGVFLPIFNYEPRPLIETRFNTIVITNQYDGFADPIADPGNFLTVLNAFMGAAYVHPWSQNSDLSAVPASNIVTTVNSLGGTTTTYLIPTQHLPLTMPLRQMGVPDPVVDSIDAQLRPMIDAGYVETSRPALTRSGAQRRSRSRTEAVAAASAVDRPDAAAPSRRTTARH